MCGIAGIITLGHAPNPHTRTIVGKMAAAQHHRGPDATDIFLSSCGTCALGHNRLSIIDLNAHATQPMADYTGRYRIVFNGEIYNYRELKQTLPDYPYRTDSDTEVILAAWHKWGEDCVTHFIGMFAFALWDDKEKKIILFRDRLGIKPLHYTLHDNCLTFASEIKALLESGIKAEADLTTWADYLNLGLYDHTDATFFKNICSLPAGHKLTYRDGTITITPYWQLSDYVEQDFQGSFEDAQEQYYALLQDSVKLRLRADVPLGVNVSGGLDSSSLMALVDKVSTSDKLESFTVSFKDTIYNEEDYANLVPVTKQWKRHIQTCDGLELWNNMGKLMYHQEAPFGGIGTLSYFKLFEKIDEQNITVILEGQGVDECLGGYNYYQNLDKRTPKTYQDGTSFLRPECLSKTITAQLPQAIPNLAPKTSALNAALYQDVRHNKLPRVLRMNDRLSMAYSKELREPFLDHRIVEFCFSLPDHFKIRNGQGKILLRETMKRDLPNTILTPPKRSVVTPQREWIKTIFHDKIRAILQSADFKETGFFNPANCNMAFDEFLNGQGDNAFFIWQWINATLWAKTFKVQF